MSNTKDPRSEGERPTRRPKRLGQLLWLSQSRSIYREARPGAQRAAAAQKSAVRRSGSRLSECLPSAGFSPLSVLSVPLRLDGRY